VTQDLAPLTRIREIESAMLPANLPGASLPMTVKQRPGRRWRQTHVSTSMADRLLYRKCVQRLHPRDAIHYS
jgi:hypothetical protein